MAESRSRPSPAGADRPPDRDPAETRRRGGGGLRDEIERRNDDLRLVARIVRDFAAAHSTEEMLPRIAAAARRMSEGDGAYLERLDRVADEVEVVAADGWGAPPLGTRVPYPGSLAQQVVHRGAPEIIPRLDLEPRPMGRILRASCGVCAGLIAPLVSEAEVLGALVVLRRPTSPAFTPDEAARVRTLADLATALLLRIRLFAESERRLRRAEQAEARFESLCRLNLDPVFLLDDRGRFISVNPAAVRLGGYPPERILGEPFDPLIHPEDRAEARAAFRHVLEGVARSLEVRFVRRDGRWLRLEITAVPTRVDGRTVGLFAVARDVTRQREAERAIRASEAHFRHMADDAPVVLWVTDAAGMCTYINRPWYELTGQTPETALGHGWLAAVHPDDRAALARRFRDAAGRRERFGYEYRVRRRDGEYRWVLGAGAPRLGVEGELIGYVGAVLDISDRKRAEAERERLIGELRLERSRLAGIFELAPAFMVVMRGPAHVIEMANPRTRALIGGRELVGRPVREAVPELEEQGYLARLDHVLRTGEPYIGREAPLRLQPRPDAPAEVIYADVVFQPMFGAAGQITGVFVHGVDVTGLVRARQEAESVRRAAEEARRAAVEANAAKSEFLAVMSHELRTPLNAILGFSDLLKEEVVGPLNERQKDQIIRIRESGRHLLELIEQILSLSRIEAGREQVEPERFDAASLARDIVAMLKPLAEDKALDLRLSLPDRPLEMDTDPAKLRQILLNLLGNAIKFTDRGRVELEVEDRDEEILFHVRDTGPGIAPEDRERIFEPFTQVDARATGEKTGTGLGLAVSRDLARLLGGDITLESEVGRGSTFTVRLPRRAPREA